MTIMLLEWVFTSTFLVLVVLALRAALGRRMSAGLRYALWAVVLARLLVPVQLFTSPIAGTWVVTEKHTEHSVVQRPASPTAPAGEAVGLPAAGIAAGTAPAFPNAPSAPDVPDAPEPPAPPDLTRAPAWLGWAWLAGTATAALVFLLSNLRFFRRLRRARIPLEGVDCPLRVYVAVGLPSPCLFGVVRPAVYVTPEAAADPAMLRHVLAHEYTHYKHGDHIWSLLRCAALAVHWWNPLVWLAVVCSRRDGELACDEGALKRLGDGERAAYGGTLLALVTAKPRPGDLFRCATTMAGDKRSLKERISRIAQAPKRVLWAVVVVVTVTALACVCAFGQVEPAEEQDPAPSPDPTVSADPAASGDPLDAQVPDLEELLTHFTADTGGVPEDVIHFVGKAVLERYDSYRSYLAEHPLTDDPIGFDGWRVQALSGPWHGTACDMDLEVWRVNYEFHTTTPEAAMNLVNGGAYLDDDGWLCPTYPNFTYAVFLVNDVEKLAYLTDFTDNSVSPEGDTEVFFGAVGRVLAQKGMVDPEGIPDVDLNRNGIPETIQVVGQADVQRVEIWEGGKLIFQEEGFHAHAGWTSLFLRRGVDGDYLLRYLPTMYGGVCDYSYQLFTLENDRETVVLENSLEFDINFQPWLHQSFDPEAIANYVGDVNSLLTHSVQLLNTDEDLLETFKRNGQLYDDLWWLDTWEPVFVRDGSKSLLENLKDFQAAMEGEWDDPWGLTLTAGSPSPTGVLLHFIQAGGAPTGELHYGSRYWLEREKDEGGWTKVPNILEPGVNLFWTDEAYSIPMDGQTSQEEDWSWLYGELPPGRYRIGKEVTDFRKAGDYDKRTYYAEFFVD